MTVLTIMAPKIKYLTSSYLILAMATNAMSQESKGTGITKDAAKSGLRSLDLLPNGTSLEGVRIPRYTSAMKPHSLIKAKKIKKESSKLLKVEGLHVTQYHDDGTGKLTVQLANADYNLKNKIVYALAAPMQLSNEQLHTKAKGIILDVNSQSGFLIGPTTSVMAIPEDALNKTSDHHPKNTNDRKTKTASTTKRIPLPEVPNALTAEKIKQLDDLLHSSELQKSHQAEVQKQSHIKNIGKGIRNDASAFLKNHLPEQHDAILSSKLSSSTTTSEEKANTSSLKISCDGGMFYNAEKGLLSYLTNIKVTEPRLKIQCSKDLQVHLATKEEKVENNKGVKKIIAVGNVKIEATVEDKGVTKHLTGSADVIEFNYIAGTTTLKGGFPSIIVKENGLAIKQTAKKKDQWLIVQRNGSVRTDGGIIQEIIGLNKDLKK